VCLRSPDKRNASAKITDTYSALAAPPASFHKFKSYTILTVPLRVPATPNQL
jgi:hypothetical protein